ncbi:hypothetical protein Vretifemale_6774, partial [Volvox reticuliferus]
ARLPAPALPATTAAATSAVHVSPLLPKFLKLSGTRGAPASSAPINSVNGTASELNRNGSGSNHSNPCSAAAGSGGKLQTRCRSSGCTVRRGCRRFARLLNGSGNGSGSRAVSASASKTSATMRRTTAPRQAASFSISPGGRYRSDVIAVVLVVVLYDTQPTVRTADPGLKHENKGGTPSRNTHTAPPVPSPPTNPLPHHFLFPLSLGTRASLSTPPRPPSTVIISLANTAPFLYPPPTQYTPALAEASGQRHRRMHVPEEHGLRRTTPWRHQVRIHY